MAMAQIKVTGTVVSQEDEPVVGASVLVVGTKTGTVTDVDSKFSLTVAEEGAKPVSYLGLLPKITASENMQITLTSDDKTLNEVVVTAMGIKRSPKALGYSATQVNGDKIAETFITSNDVMTSLQVRLPVSQLLIHLPTQVLLTL